MGRRSGAILDQLEENEEAPEALQSGGRIGFDHVVERLQRGMDRLRLRFRLRRFVFTGQEIEQVEDKGGRIVQLEVRLSVVDAGKDSADDQLFGVDAVDVGGAVGPVALARPDVRPLLLRQEFQQLRPAAVVPDQHRTLRVVGQDFQELFGRPAAQTAGQVRRQHGGQRLLDGRVGRRSVAARQVAGQPATGEEGRLGQRVGHLLFVV